ncbi:O-acetyltransferase oatA [Staphylococcus aureus]|nr:O-acetyltransferase oatA [Staphylococcus aureus]
MEDFTLYHLQLYSLLRLRYILLVFAKFLSMKPLLIIGKRSYSLYLWHYPIIVFVNSYYVQGQIPVYVYIIEILLTALMAEISYRFIETPIRKKGFKAFAFLPKRRVNLLELC